MATRRSLQSDEIHLEAESPSMRRVWALAARVAPLDSTVLITGETGVGKDLLARWLHEHSRRARCPYVAINCAAMPDALLESELFGHAKGAFTGADGDRGGLFEAAQNGTLFLDEIGDVSPGTQAKLLRVLQDSAFRRLGETRLRRVDVRFIAATNRDLPAAVADHRFREDLYYRLRVVDLHVPPLRERREDLLYLCRDLLARTAAALRRPITGYRLDALDLMLAYSWPGNVRQLEHAIERACAMCAGTEICPEDLPDQVRQTSAPRARPLDDVERQHILAVLERTGSQRLAAKELDISLSTLWRKLRAYRQMTNDPTSDT
jgi:two-component system, NtrC family, response regulator HydG